MDRIESKIEKWLKSQKLPIPPKRRPLYVEALTELARVITLPPKTRSEISKIDKEDNKRQTRRNEEIDTIEEERAKSQKELEQFQSQKYRIIDPDILREHLQKRIKEVEGWKLIEKLANADLEDLEDPKWNVSPIQPIREPLFCIITLFNEDGTSENDQKKVLISLFKHYEYVSYFGEPINGYLSWSEFPKLSDFGLPMLTDDILRNNIEKLYRDTVKRCNRET
jgi:hypothetical protein|tara:strand:- start:814 stop:1485 length:672 start_codon:yes stop_codon:yes gene_type:complete